VTDFTDSHVLFTAAYAGAIALAAPYLYYAFRHYPTTFIRQEPGFSLDLVRLILPTSDKLFGLSPLILYPNHVGRSNIDDYVGIPLLLIPFALVIFAGSNRIGRLLAVTFVFVVALAAGPNLIIGNRWSSRLPWARLWSLPIARSAEPSRYMIFGYLVLAIALALWLAAPARSRLLRAAHWALGVLAVAVLIADPPFSYPALDSVQLGFRPPATMHPVNQVPPFIADGLYRKYLAPGETVVIVTYRGNAGMLFQADVDFYFRIAGGYINASLTRPDALPGPVAGVGHDTPARVRQFRSYVRAAGIGAVIVERAWAAPWMLTVFTAIGRHGTAAGGVIIYPVGPWLDAGAHGSARDGSSG